MNGLNKKLLQTEKNLMTKIKLVQSGKQELEASVNTKKPEKNLQVDLIKTLKVRISNLEKLLEFSK